MNKKQIKAEQDSLMVRIKLQKRRYEKALEVLQKERYTLYLLESNICFFQFDNQQDAKEVLDEHLYWIAQKDCIGVYNRGEPEYTQKYQLIESDLVYLAKIKVKYNHHDDMHYFIDEVEYSYTEVKGEKP